MMTKLEKLIKELCPNGVEYIAIKDYFTRLKGTPITAAKMKEIESSDGEIRIFAGGKTVINTHEKDIPNANVTSVPAVLVQSRGVIDFIYYEKPFTFKNEMWAYTTDNKITVKFLYYVLQNNTQHFRDSASGMGSLPQIPLHVTEDFKIPIPPLEVQAEIVRILDNFTELVAELMAELTARKKQYEYYRDYLLNFGSECYLRTIKDACIIKRGKYITKKSSIAGDIPVILGGQYPAYYIDCSNHNGEAVVISRSGAYAGFVSFWNEPIFVTDGFIYEGKDGLMTKFLYYILKNMQYNLYKMKKGGGVPHVQGKEIEKIKIPVPPIEEQKRIVEILDRFDKLCNNISEGLPAEIEARQKQYEYYRDKLLSFEEVRM